MSEPLLQKTLSDLLRDRAQIIPIRKSTINGINCVADLTGNVEYDLLAENETKPWKKCPEVGVNIIGGSNTRPDIILSSKGTGQQRILFEVKYDSGFTHIEPKISQVIRYFLYLLYTTEQKPKGKNDIRRGIFLVAPSKWFDSTAVDKGPLWRSSVESYRELAGHFDITFGEIHSEDLALK